MISNPYAPPLAAVRDIAERHAMNDPADRGTRLGAAILDGIIFSAMVYAPLVFVAMFGRAATAEPGAANANTMVALAGGLTFVGFVAWCWLTISRMRANGQSIGKKFLDIKVVRTDGSPVSLGRLIGLRNIVNMLISFVPLYSVIDALFIFGESRRCLHDKLADTIVVKA
jgi:uncharacterized RDD family membrane protein YckC